MNTSPSQVGVVIPAYKAERYLAQTLDTLLAQTYAAWRAVVVDDGSPDASAKIAEDFARREPRLEVVRQANGGPGRARNAGAKHLLASSPKPEYLTFLDSDDLWEPDAIETLVNVLDAAPNCGGAHGNARDIDAQGDAVLDGSREQWGRSRLTARKFMAQSEPASDLTEFHHMVVGPCIVNCGVLLVRTSAFERIGGCCEALQGPEDWDFEIRLSRLAPLKFIDRVLLSYRKHGTGVSSVRSRTVKAVQAVRWRAIHCRNNTKEQRRAARRGYRAFYLFMARCRWDGFLRSRRAGDLKLVLANASMGVIGRPPHPRWLGFNEAVTAEDWSAPVNVSVSGKTTA